MRAITYHRYGAPDVIGLEEVPSPTPADGQLLVRVHAGVVTPSDGAARKGQPFLIRLMGGIRRPRQPILGSEVAGEVAAVGAGVSRFKVGDRVMAATGDTYGGHAEFVVLPEDGAVEHMPAGATFEQGVGLAEGPATALPFLRDHGGVKPGMHVLINGGSGSVGSAAIQLAKYLGAEVTGVASTAKGDLMRELGADHVIDYTTADPAAVRDRYDVFFDVAGKTAFSAVKDSLREGGIYLDTYPSMNTMWHQLVTTRFGSKKAKFAATGLRKPEQKRPDLALFRELFEEGRLRPIIDRTFSMEQAAEAHAYVDSGHKTGNVVLDLAGGRSGA